MEQQKLLDEILVHITKGENDKDSFEKLLSKSKQDYKSQKIEIENQFDMLINMITATKSQLLNQLEQKHKSHQDELNKKIGKLLNYTKEIRKEKNECNKDSKVHLTDIHEKSIKKYNDIVNDKYVHKTIEVIIDTQDIMKIIPKIAYINEKSKNDAADQRFKFHSDNKNINVKPIIIALNTNSMNTKICVSWKLQPVKSGLLVDKINDNDDKNNDDKNNDDNDDDDDSSTPSLSANNSDIETLTSVNVHDINSIDIEWRYSDSADGDDDNKSNTSWNILDVEHNKILAFNLETSIFDHILNTTRYGHYYFRITLYTSGSSALSLSSSQSKMTTFKIKIRHIADEWNQNKKQKQVRIGFFNKRVVTRDIPGKFRHIFGSLIISRGVNVWTLKIKKIDSNRQKCTAMIGVINMNNRNNNNQLKSLNQCFSHIGIGYGLFCANGDVYHTKSPRLFGKQLKEGDIIQIMCDYRAQTISFIVNNINWGVAFDRNHFPNNKMPQFGLCCALRGCDEIQLIDYVNESKSLFPKHRRRSSSGDIGVVVKSSSKPTTPSNYGKLEQNSFPKTKVKRRASNII